MKSTPSTNRKVDTPVAQFTRAAGERTFFAGAVEIHLERGRLMTILGVMPQYVTLNP